MESEPSKVPFEDIDPETDKVASLVVDSAYQVHINIGPGLLESAYEACLVHELKEKGLKVEQQVAVPLVYKGIRLSVGFRLDLLVEDKVIVEIKAVEQLTELHRAQVITYLKLARKKLGFLINFNTPIFKKGIDRIALSKKIRFSWRLCVLAVTFAFVSRLIMLLSTPAPLIRIPPLTPNP